MPKMHIHIIKCKLARSAVPKIAKGLQDVSIKLLRSASRGTGSPPILSFSAEDHLLAIHNTPHDKSRYVLVIRLVVNQRRARSPFCALFCKKSGHRHDSLNEHSDI